MDGELQSSIEDVGEPDSIKYIPDQGTIQTAVQNHTRWVRNPNNYLFFMDVMTDAIAVADARGIKLDWNPFYKFRKILSEYEVVSEKLKKVYANLVYMHSSDIESLEIRKSNLKIKLRSLFVSLKKNRAIAWQGIEQYQRLIHQKLKLASAKVSKDYY